MSFPRLSTLPPDVIAVAVALLLLSGVFLIRRLWLRLLGPVFVYEADRVARRGRTSVVRVVYVLVLLGILFLSHPRVEVMTLDPNSDPRVVYPQSVQQVLSRFAAEFSHAFLIAQAVVVLLLTPIYVGGAISDEKENRSLDFLLATRMSGPEILLGKLGARLLNVFGVLLVALPVLAITQVWGGIDLPRVVAGMVATALTALSVGCISLLCSVTSRRTFPAIFGTFVVVIVLGLADYASPTDFLSNPISFQYELNKELDRLRDNSQFFETTAIMLLVYAAVHVSVAAISFNLARYQLRRRANRGLFSWVGNVTMKVGHEWTEEGVKEVRRPLRIHADLPPMGDDPLAWKERYVGRTWFGKTFQDFAWLAFLMFGVVLPLLSYLIIPSDVSAIRILGPLLGVLCVLAGVGLMLGMGFRLAGSVTREREQNTLECLLTVPITRSQLLVKKWTGTLMRMRRFLIGVVCTVLVTCLSSDVPAVLWVLLPLTIGLHAVFAANLGLFLSVVCRSTMRARVALAAILLTLTAGMWTVDYLRGPNDSVWLKGSPIDYESEVPGLVMDTLNPIQSWWRLMTGPYDPTYQDRQPTPKRDPFEWANPVQFAVQFSATLVVYGLASVLLWLAASWRFRRETGHV